MPAPVSRLHALRLLMEAAAPLDAVSRPPAEAVGLAAAADVAAGCDVPETACSLRDGFALRSADTAGTGSMRPARLAVNQLIRAESVNPDPVGPGEAARVLTGGTVPPGADCVLAEEDVDIQDGVILVTAPVRPGWFIRPVGGEIAADTVVTRQGRVITPQAAAVMARTRLSRVPVHPRPTARVLALGSELVAPGEACVNRFPADNLILASGLLEQSGAAVDSATVLPDVEARLTDVLSQPDLPDLMITTGGTGNSERDFARAGALAGGFDILFDTVDMRPGRNLFAARRGTTLLFGLPGPPAAVFTLLPRPDPARGPQAARPARPGNAARRALHQGHQRPPRLRMAGPVRAGHGRLAAHGLAPGGQGSAPHARHGQGAGFGRDQGRRVRVARRRDRNPDHPLRLIPPFP